MFSFFKRKEPPAEKTLRSLLSQYAAHQEVLGQLSRAESLDKLGRTTEASAAMSEARTAARRYAKSNPNNPKAQLLYALYLIESRRVDESMVFLQELLDRRDLQLADDERFQLESELFALRRQNQEKADGHEKT